MTTKPGEVYRVDLGIGGKTRLMVVSREDANAPRALSLCAPITTKYRGSAYEVEIGKLRFLREVSYVNVQGVQAIQHHELSRPIGRLPESQMAAVRAALKYALDIE
jgi:mRNA-degrading endonuclease toxin of MazEF toxin-antitoxin module